MAIYKIFPNKDATIYSEYPCKNTGRDEILDVSVRNKQYKQGATFFTESICRALLSFSNTDIQKLKSFESASFDANLKLYLAYAQNLTQDYSVECYSLSQSWDMGIGKASDTPYSKSGVSWTSVGECESSLPWSASFGTMQYYHITGGGTWNTNLAASQSFDYTSNKDINLDITKIVDAWFSGSINHGLLLKQSSSVESNTGSFSELQYFSIDTHTIYPPCLEFKWDDSTYEINPSNVKYILTNDFVLSLENNTSEYKENSLYTFRIKARDKYPARQFTTSSIYLNWKYLPEHSYWALQDYKTEEMIIDFDSTYTRISADYYGNYFDIYMNGLQPERFYKILIKTRIYRTNYGPLSLFSEESAIYDALNTYTEAELDQLPYQEVIVDNDLFFKISR